VAKNLGQSLDTPFNHDNQGRPRSLIMEPKTTMNMISP